MCRKVTPKEEHIKCSRCNKVANPTDSWEYGWPLYGKLEIGFPGQAFAYLGGAEYIADKEHFAWWSKGHPAMVRNEAQEVVFEWGNGYKYDSEKRFRMCYYCQKELLYAIGKFFKIPQEVEKLKETQ